MHRPPLGRWAPLAAVVLGSAALTPTAGAAVDDPSHIIEVVANTSDITIGGVENAAIELRRNGVVLNTGTASGDPGGGEAGLNSDHVPGGCWNGFVPQMLPGDQVHNTTNGDFITLGDVKVTSPITEENGAVVFRGTYSGPLPAGHGLDATIDPATDGFRWSDGSSGGQFLSAGAGDEGGTLTDHGNGTWTARWANLTGAEKQQALGGHGGASVGIEHDVAATGGEVTAWHFGESGGGFGGCNETYRPNEVTGFGGRNAINATDANVVVNGVAQPGVTAVEVTLTDSDGGPVTATATPSAAGAWSASVPAGQFADGPVAAAVQMTLGGNDFAGVGKSITKDTVAPGAPTANTGPGTYPQAVNVALTGENVRYTTDGSTPTAGSQAYGSALRVDKSQTIKAVSVDAAGNTSPVAEFAYTIQPPPAAPAAAAVVTAPAPALLAPPSIPSAAASSQLRLESLTVARRMTLGSARRSGMRLVIATPDGAKAVRIRLRRGGKTISSVVRRVSADGVLRVTLPGSRKQRRALRRGTYRVQITPGSSTSSIDGATTSRSITLG